MITINRAKKKELDEMKAGIKTKDEDLTIESLERELAKMSNQCLKSENEIKAKEVWITRAKYSDLTYP